MSSDSVEYALMFLYKFLKDLKDGERIKFQDGLLITGGCDGGYKCCAASIDVNDTIEALEELGIKKWWK